MAKSASLSILVIGSTGHGGSYLCIELCNRGHKVTGLARNPAKLGTHANYIPKQLDVVNCSFAELHQALEGYDVVIKYDNYLIPVS
jgi:putative NADH-flavin reductase